jgi:hypothetical protein
MLTAAERKNVRTEVDDITAFLDTLQREVPVAVTSSERTASPSATERSDLDISIRMGCAAIRRALDTEKAKYVDGATADTLAVHRRQVVTADGLIAETRSRIAELTRDIQASRNLSSSVLTAMPLWLSRKLDDRRGELANLQSREKLLAQERAAASDATKRHQASLEAERNVVLAIEKLPDLKLLVERLVVHIGLEAEVEKTRQQVEEARRITEREAAAQLRVSEARRAALAAAKLAAREAARLEIPELPPYDPQIESKVCSACGNLLAFDGVCIHCSR